MHVRNDPHLLDDPPDRLLNGLRDDPYIREGDGGGDVSGTAPMPPARPAGTGSQQLLRELLAAAPAVVARRLGDPRLAASVLTELLRRRPELARAPAVAARLLAHPHLPPSLLPRLAESLEWKTLADAAAQPGIARAARRTLAGLLERRLGQMTLGETISLARRAPTELLPSLLAHRDERVVRAALGNPRTRADDVSRLLSESSRQPERAAALGSVMSQTRWRALAAAGPSEECTESQDAPDATERSDGP
ncbi:MAG: hypothetical protein JSV80_07475 [Acidobacteriota bacterium]|nr:MAG: hypothetical protein JSV80_07475 [Acidobacteriota bacterium]